MKLLRWLLHRLLLIRIGETGNWEFPPVRTLAHRSGNILVVLAILPLFLLQISSLSQHAQFGPASLVEETAYTYTSAKNYLTYGFSNSGFLQDFSNSPYPEDHPYVYTHMPPGPDLVTAVLLAATGHSYPFVRLIFAVVFMLGFWCYVRFAEVLLRQGGLAGGGFVILFFVPWLLVQGMDRLIYSPFPLLAFAPILLVLRSADDKRRAFLWLAGITAFLGALYLEYSTLVGVLASWLMLGILGLLPIERKRLLVLLLPAIGGILAHLVQNLVYLGPEVFLKELVTVVSNRITGFPSQEALKDWYNEIGIVHHGSRPVSISALWAQVKANAALTTGTFLVSAALIGFLLAFSLKRLSDARFSVSLPREPWRMVGHLVKTAVWSGVTILTPIVAFPAFGQEVNLKGSGANTFYLAILGVALIGFAMQRIYQRFPVNVDVSSRASDPVVIYLPRGSVNSAPQEDAEIQESPIGTVRILLAVGIAGLLALSIALIANHRKNQYFDVFTIYRTSNLGALSDLAMFNGKLFLTNINTPVVGFLTSAPGFGVCEPDTVGRDGTINLDRCKVAFMRRHSYWKAMSPKYFFFFKDGAYFPGFADCMPSKVLAGEERGGDSCVRLLQDRLSENYRLVYSNEVFDAFDLQAHLRDSR